MHAAAVGTTHLPSSQTDGAKHPAPLPDTVHESPSRGGGRHEPLLPKPSHVPPAAQTSKKGLQLSPLATTLAALHCMRSELQKTPDARSHGSGDVGVSAHELPAGAPFAHVPPLHTSPGEHGLLVEHD